MKRFSKLCICKAACIQLLDWMGNFSFGKFDLIIVLIRSGVFSGKSIIIQPAWMGVGKYHPGQDNVRGFRTAAALPACTVAIDFHVGEAAESTNNAEV